jgi:hypothetical protein
MHCGLYAYCAPLDLVPPVISRGAPRPTTWETSVSVGGNYGRGNGRFNFAYKCDFHGKCTDLLHAAMLRHGTDGFTSPLKEGMLRIFVARKIRRLQPDLNPRTWVPEASMLTTRPLEQLICILQGTIIIITWNKVLRKTFGHKRVELCADFQTHDTAWFAPRLLYRNEVKHDKLISICSWYKKNNNYVETFGEVQLRKRPFCRQRRSDKNLKIFRHVVCP